MAFRTSDERHQRFVEFGYFAPELPPCFTSKDFAKRRNDIVERIMSLPDEGGRKAYQKFISDKAIFHFPRFRNADRVHSIINPISFLFLSQSISKNYLKLKNVERKSKYSASPSFFDWLGYRALRHPVFKKRDEFISQVSTRFEYLANTDIRSFYHSIYTHSIPWAIHGKSFAKNHRSLAHFGNEIDLLVRNAQGGQTIGLPVGPDTSRILAEVIASNIDEIINIHLRFKENDATRFVDDFTFGCNSISEGQRIIAEVRRAVSLYNLDIGSEKTSVQETNHLEYVGWKEYLRGFLPNSASKGEFERFFYVSHDMAKKHRNLNIDKFSMQISRKLFIESEDWGYLQEHIISSYRRNSTVIELLVEIILLRNDEKSDVDCNSLLDFVSSRLPLLAEQQRTGEAIWLIFMCIRLQITIPAKSIEQYFRYENPLVAILILIAARRRLVKGKIDQTKWDESASQDGLRSDMWLYAYEAGVRGWANVNDSSYISRDPFYSILSDFNIKFINMNVKQESLKQILRERRIDNIISNIQKNNEGDDDENELEELLGESYDEYQ